MPCANDSFLFIRRWISAGSTLFNVKNSVISVSGCYPASNLHVATDLSTLQPPPSRPAAKTPLKEIKAVREDSATVITSQNFVISNEMKISEVMWEAANQISKTQSVTDMINYCMSVVSHLFILCSLWCQHSSLSGSIKI